MDELRLWIKDIVRNGILNIPDKGFSYFENMAKRMVDAQTPGLANMVRNIGKSNFYTEGWHSPFIDKLAAIYMVLEGYKNIDCLNEPQQQEIKSLVGFTQNQEALKEQTGLTDTWLVLCKQIVEVDTITTERNWLYGTTSNRYALVLQFIVNGQGATLALTAGMFIQAEVVFYPSVAPLRAIVKKQVATNASSHFTSFNNWQQVSETETVLSSVMPVRDGRPFIVRQLIPVQYNNHWWLQDAEQKMMRLKNGQASIWKLLALSGGNAIDMAVIGKEDNYEPLGIWHQNEYRVL